ncbi:Aste57867_8255 [Aphanomyces stellatus]|uniref:Aste57867_8255 protein n=1 Tax=Aphanomyces stellatus TaxID=120398 RepID=A0A485KJX6_9STRA|nr:hypothetical protein As57867_008224 [Aphanomyces stellatus]VFT85142.1 Aste57867_8255 [Aphanomyces stellatus]
MPLTRPWVELPTRPQIGTRARHPQAGGGDQDMHTKRKHGAHRQKAAAAVSKHFGAQPLTSSFSLLAFDDVVARRRQQQRTSEDTTAAERRAFFAQIRKMAPWQERMAAVMKKRRHRARWLREHHKRERHVEDAWSGDDTRWVEMDGSPFLADIETLVGRRRSHRMWVQTDPLQVMFREFYKMMEA